MKRSTGAPVDIEKSAVAEAQRIVVASDAELQELIWRGVKERWLSRLVHGLNALELRPATRDLAQRALKKIGFS